MAIQISRRCIPFTPFERPLNKAIVAMVSSTGVHMKSQEPFDINDEQGDRSFRVIPANVELSDLMITNSHYNHSDVDSDLNCIFPIETLQGLIKEGLIGGIAEKSIGLMGYSMQMKRIQEDTAPKIATELERSRADAVLMMAGCPVSHRTICTIQREIELRGISTVLITLKPEESRPLRPPRCLYPMNFRLGHCVGAPQERMLHRQIVLDALSLLNESVMPGTVIERSYSEYRV
ncbi:MAG: glycine/sarcosine/betaine reductase selenoprotein B family protein [Acidobacteriota bacterium]